MRDYFASRVSVVIRANSGKRYCEYGRMSYVRGKNNKISARISPQKPTTSPDALTNLIGCHFSHLKRRRHIRSIAASAAGAALANSIMPV